MSLACGRSAAIFSSATAAAIHGCTKPQVRLAKRFRLADRRVLELTTDLFNVLNFLDGDWGLPGRS